MEKRDLEKNNLVTIPEAIKELQKGNFIIVVDDVDRENEGDLVIAAEKITEQQMGFLIRYSSGIVCIPSTAERLDELQLYPMVQKNTQKHKTAFTVSIDGKINGATTGISGKDRTLTVKMFVNPKTKPEQFARPGHMFPLRAHPAGVLGRGGHTEASVDLMKLAGMYPAAVIGEVMNDDGTVASMVQLTTFAKKHNIKIASIADLAHYRRSKEMLVKRQKPVRFPTAFGEFTLLPYIDTITGDTHLVLIKGKVKQKRKVLVRMHSECLTGDVLHSLRCDCGTQLDKALMHLAKEKEGILLYLRQEGRGIGLLNKLHAYHLQDNGLDTVEANTKLGFRADERDYSIAAQILKDLRVKSIRLMTNNPKKLHGLEGYGISVVERLPLETMPSKFNKKYLRAKKKKLGHWLSLP